MTLLAQRTQRDIVSPLEPGLGSCWAPWHSWVLGTGVLLPMVAPGQLWWEQDAWKTPGHSGAAVLHPSGNAGGLGWHKTGQDFGTSSEIRVCLGARGV